MGKQLGKVTDWSGITNIKGEKRAGEESRRIGEQQAASQQLAVDYLQGLDEAPQQLSQGATRQYSSLLGLGGDQQQAMSQLRNSPIYQSIMGGMQQGEEAIARNQQATGGFRSGTTQSNLATHASNLQNQAVMQSIRAWSISALRCSSVRFR
jgi:hypothetical protein